MTEKIILYVTMTIMAILSIIILYKDSTKMKIKFLWLFLFDVTGFIGVIADKILTGSFHPAYLMFIPLGVVLYLLNNRLPHSIMGKGDLDVLFGTVALLVPVTYEIFTQEAPAMIKDKMLVNLLQFQGLVIEMLVFFVIGSIIALIIGFARYFISKVIQKKQVKGLKYEILADLSVNTHEKFRKMGIPATSVYLLPYMYLVYYTITTLK